MLSHVDSCRHVYLHSLYVVIAIDAFIILTYQQHQELTLKSLSSNTGTSNSNIQGVLRLVCQIFQELIRN